MAKMRKPGHTKLSGNVGAVWRKHKNKPRADAVWVTFVEASGTLLEKMRLPAGDLAKAKGLAAHEIRLIQAGKSCPVSVKTGVKIIETIERGIPRFIEMHKDTFNRKQIASLESLLADIQKKLPEIRKQPEDNLITLPPAIVETASLIQSSELHQLLGTKRYDLYRRAMRRTMKALRG